MQPNLFGSKQLKVIKHAGDLNSALLEEDGTTVHRSQSITIPNMGTITCAPYDNQFVFRHIYEKNGTPVRNWTLFCTCGSPAVVTGYDGYAKDASMGTAMVVCYHHATHNRHADGSS